MSKTGRPLSASPRGLGSGSGMSLFHAGADYTTRRVFRLSKRSGQWKWKEMPSLHTGRFLPAVVASGSAIVVLGGQASLGSAPFSFDFWGVEVNSVEVFDVEKPEKGWTELPPIPWMGRQLMGACAIGKDVYIFGGSHTNYSHIGKDQAVPGVAGQRGLSAAKILADTYFGLRRHCGDAYVLNLQSRRWRRLPDLPFPVAAWSAVAYKDRYILLLGGIKNKPVEHPYEHQDKISGAPSPNFDVLVFDTINETYRILPTPMPAYQIHPAQFEAKGMEVILYDVSRGGYRVNSKLWIDRKQAVPLRRRSDQPAQRDCRGHHWDDPGKLTKDLRVKDYARFSRSRLQLRKE